MAKQKVSPAGGEAAGPNGGQPKKDGCIKRASTAYTKWSRSACGASILAIIKIVLAVNSITAVWRSWSALSDNVFDIASVPKSWQARPLVDVSAVLASGACPSGYEALTSVSWPGAQTPSCACPFRAVNPANNVFVDSSITENCDGNQTAAGCFSAPTLPPITLTEWVGAFSLCGLFDGSPSLSTEGVERPLPSAGACPSGFQVCGGGGAASPTWDDHRALCIEAGLPCPIRVVNTNKQLPVLGLLTGTQQGGPDEPLVLGRALPRPDSGDRFLLLNSVSGAHAVGEVLPGNASLRLTNVTGAFGASVGDALNLTAAAALSTQAVHLALQAPIPPVVAYKVAMDGIVCFGSNIDVPVQYAGQGRNGYNDYSDQCLTRDTRWVPAAQVAEVGVLASEFFKAPECTSRVNETSVPAVCDSCPPRGQGLDCRAVACTTLCERLETYAVAANTLWDADAPADSGALDAAETGVSFIDTNIPGKSANQGGGGTQLLFSEPHTLTTMVRHETYWRPDCKRPRSQLVEVLDPLQGLRRDQQQVALIISALSIVTIITAAFILLTLSDKGLTCIAKSKVTQRIVIAYYGSIVSSLMNGGKVALLVLVTLVIADIRAFFAIFAINAGDACAGDDALTNDTLADLGRSLTEAYDNNILAIITDSVLLLVAAYGILSEAFDGVPLVEKGKGEK